MANWTYVPGNDPNKTNAASSDISSGYYVGLPVETDGTGNPMDPANHSPSGYLEDYLGNQVFLWITQAAISFQIGGTFAQSPRLRQFFPRNLIQPVWTIQGIVPNSFQFQRLGEFVRQTQFHALNPNGLSDVDTHLPRLNIYAGNLGNLSNITQAGLAKLNNQQQDYLSNNSLAVQGKGPHYGQFMRGYIDTFSRGAQKFINAPTYEFSFSVAFSYGDLLITQDPGTVYQRLTQGITYQELGTGSSPS